MTGAIERYRPLKPVAIVQLAADGVACELHVRSFNKREKCAIYELVVANQTDVGVSCRIYGTDKSSQASEFGVLAIAKHSAGSSHFAIPFTSGPGQRIYIELVGEGLNLFAEAFRQAPVARARWQQTITIACVLLTLVVALGAGYLFEKPSIQALGVPKSSAPGPVTATYAIGGRAAASYLASMNDGTVLSSGALSAASGEIIIVVPPGAAGHAVHLSLEVRGPLGHAARTAYISIVPVPRRPLFEPARIASLAAHRENESGQPNLVATYTAVGDRGTLRVIDLHGTVVASVPFSHAGSSHVPLDAVSSGGLLRAELEVERGMSRAISAVEIPADRSEDPMAAVESIVERGSGLPTITGLPATGSDSAPSSADAFSVPNRVIAGETFDVTIRRPLPSLRIALKDGLGAIVHEVGVPPDAKSISFSAPASTTVETYYIAATFERGTSEETLVRSLRIYPR